MAATEKRTIEAGSTVPHLTVAERVARGKAAREEVPRSSHAVFEPAPHRVDPIGLLDRQAETRVPELVPIRYGRMLVSPFTFYRGAAMIMASDLVATPRSGLNVQCCGDAHLSNFGVFASPERRLVFDLNDFDETLPGPWEWDVKRLAASVLIAARENGFAVKDQDRAVLGTVEAYRTTMASFAAMRNLDVWYARLDIEAVLAKLGPQLIPGMVKRTEKNLAKARARDSMSAFSKLTRVVDGQARIVAEPPLVVPVDDLLQGLEHDEMFDWLREPCSATCDSTASWLRHLALRFSSSGECRRENPVPSRHRPRLCRPIHSLTPSIARHCAAYCGKRQSDERSSRERRGVGAGSSGHRCDRLSTGRAADRSVNPGFRGSCG